MSVSTLPNVAEADLKPQFFDAMSNSATTVNIVTTDGKAGRAGVTVSAMSSVSADTPKPTLLVCINENSAAAEMILDNRVYCVNVLRSDQSYISDVFAGRYKNKFEDKFDCLFLSDLSPRCLFKCENALAATAPRLCFLAVLARANRMRLWV